MMNRKLQELYQSPNNGKQLVELADGRRLVLVHCSEEGFPAISLWRSQSAAPNCFANFEQGTELAGPGSGLAGYGGSLVLTEDRLHFACTMPYRLGIQYRSAKIGGDSLPWSPAEKVIEGDMRLGDLVVSDGGTPAMVWQRRGKDSDDSVGVAWPHGDGWKTQQVHSGGSMFPPVADVDQDGVLHMAWFTPAEELFYARLAGWSAEPEVEQIGYGAAPSLLCHRPGQILLACEDQYGFPQSYRFDGKEWSGPNRTMRRPWFTLSDQLHSPQLARDRHGVMWMFWSDNTRRSVFWSRWLEHEWSEPYNGPRVYHRTPRFDSNLLPVGRLSVQKRSRPTTPDVGMLMITEGPGEVVEYGREVVPDLKPVDGQKILFFDLLELAETKGIQLHVEEAVKHPENPLMEHGPEGAFDQDRVFNHGRVMFDEGRYRMWYGGLREPRPGEPRSPWWDWIHCGYAESDDGIQWRRVNVGLVEWNGSKDNNMVPYLGHAPVVIKDESDPDPNRRYKAFYVPTAGQHLEMSRSDKYGRRYDPLEEMYFLDLMVSPDGLHVERIEGEIRFACPQAKPTSSIPQCVFRDDDEPDPQKRYKAYGYMALNLRRRGTCYLTSPDCAHWTAYPEIPVIDPAVRGMPPVVGGPTGQVHDTVVMPYEGYYVALYQDQHDPENMPVELAVSRDSETFRHVRVGTKVIPLGQPDQWDALTILPSIPVVLDEQIRLYYGGGREVVGDDGRRRWDTRPGLATLRRDGFTALRLAAGTKAGWLETIPFSVPRGAHQLRINANCPAGTEIRVAVIDEESGNPIEGYAGDAAVPLADDSLDTVVRWKRAESLPGTRRPVRLRFELKASEDKSPALHAFRLVSG